MDLYVNITKQIIVEFRRTQYSSVSSGFVDDKTVEIVPRFMFHRYRDSFDFTWELNVDISFKKHSNGVIWCDNKGTAEPTQSFITLQSHYDLVPSNNNVD